MNIYVRTYKNIYVRIRERGDTHTYENVEHIYMYIYTYKYVL